MHGRNVLRVNGVEETASYRDAIAEILRNIQSEHKVTLLEIADATDISLGTVSNAANKKADLNSIYMHRLGKVYGPCTLDPYHRLHGARAVPLEGANVHDIMPFIQRVGLCIAEARDPASPGGPHESLREQLNYLPQLCALQRELDALICSIQDRKAAA